MLIYIPDYIPYKVMFQICQLVGSHDWDKDSSRNKWSCNRCGKRRRAKS